MIDAPLIGAWIAQIAFWILMGIGISYNALSKRAAAMFMALWLAGYMGLPRIAWWIGPMVTSYVAVLDIALVFLIFKGDVRIT
jgi:hypothetical protein